MTTRCAICSCGQFHLTMRSHDAPVVPRTGRSLSGDRNHLIADLYLIRPLLIVTESPSQVHVWTQPARAEREYPRPLS